MMGWLLGHPCWNHCLLNFSKVPSSKYYQKRGKVPTLNEKLNEVTHTRMSQNSPFFWWLNQERLRSSYKTLYSTFFDIPSHSIYLKYPVLGTIYPYLKAQGGSRRNPPSDATLKEPAPKCRSWTAELAHTFLLGYMSFLGLGLLPAKRSTIKTEFQ